jgi:hypothetical protein
VQIIRDARHPVTQQDDAYSGVKPLEPTEEPTEDPTAAHQIDRAILRRIA